MQVLTWTAIGYLAGSIPFSVLIGRLAGAGDIRLHGDGNPGAFNVLRAAGVRWFVVATLLDGFKGAIPVGYAFFSLGIEGAGLIPVAISPVAGHAFSPWLRFRGGKAVAVTFGIWAGLTGPVGPVIFGIALLMFYGR